MAGSPVLPASWSPDVDASASELPVVVDVVSDVVVPGPDVETSTVVDPLDPPGDGSLVSSDTAGPHPALDATQPSTTSHRALEVIVFTFTPQPTADPSPTYRVCSFGTPHQPDRPAYNPAGGGG